MSAIRNLIVVCALLPIAASCGVGMQGSDQANDQESFDLKNHTLTIRSYDLDQGGSEFSGAMMTISQGSTVLKAGLTPLSVTLPSGTYTLTATNDAQHTFDHWGNGSTSVVRTVTFSNGASIHAYYHDVAVTSPDAGVDSGTSVDAGSGSGSGSGSAGPTTSTTYAGTTEDFLNPERGFYTGIDLINGTSFTSVRTGGFSLAQVNVQLDNYRNTALPQTLLDSLSAGFARVRSAGIKVKIRFRYNNPSTYPSTDPDAPKAIVLEHISQLGPILTANADVIANLDAGFIGLWGEWHGSTNGLDTTDNERDILFALLDAIPARLMVTVRTPDDKANIFGSTTPLSDTTAFTGTRQARTGHLNDCFLASDTDQGTYPSPIEFWKDYIAADANYVPEGGETCALNAPRTDCPSATAEMARLHWNQLNSQYNTQVIGAWKTQGCYTDIRLKLGYRLALLDSTWTSAVPPGGAMQLTVHLANQGYGAIYNPRPLYVVLTNGTTTLRAPINVDPRRWKSGTESTFTVNLRVPANAAPGSYKIALWMPDSGSAIQNNIAYAVRFANANVWDATTGFNVLTTALSVDPAATSSSIDPSATSFVQLP